MFLKNLYIFALSIQNKLFIYFMAKFYPHQFIVQTNTSRERAELQLVHKWCYGNYLHLAQMSNIPIIVHHETKCELSLQDIFSKKSPSEFEAFLRENRIELKKDLFHNPDAFQKVLDHIKDHEPILYLKFIK